MKTLVSDASKHDAAVPTVRPPAAARWLLPSVADLVFLVLFYVFGLGQLSRTLLFDTDIGWHIRNGEHILATRSIPHTDIFSYTRAGQTWFAWEWLYDVVIAGIHHIGGLRGVAVFSALVIALTLALLFRLALRSSGSLPFGLIVTVLATGGSSLHFLARPHLVTWLFTVLLLTWVWEYRDGRCSNLYAVPLLLALWSNIHGGFLIAFPILAIFWIADVWTGLIDSLRVGTTSAMKRCRHWSVVMGLSAAATLLTPYSYHLHAHVYQYLSDRYMIDRINEFRSPDFHEFAPKCFALLLILSLFALALARKRTKLLEVLLVAFAGWSGLYAARNIPLATIMLALVAATMLAHFLNEVAEDSGNPPLRSLLERFAGFSQRMSAIELQSRGHIIALLVLCVALWMTATHRIGSLDYDPARVPASAVDYVEQQGIHKGLFSPDFWGGYLIYREYPALRLFMDDRHDFYGDAFLRDYLEVAEFHSGWKNVLDKYGVNWVLIPPDSALATGLRASQDWQIVYTDEVALVFRREAALGTR